MVGISISTLPAFQQKAFPYFFFTKFIKSRNKWSSKTQSTQVAQVEWRREATKPVSKPTQSTFTEFSSKSILKPVFPRGRWASWTVSSTTSSRKFVWRAQNWSTTTRNIHSAAERLLLPGELAKHAVSEGTKAVTKYSSGSVWNITFYH